MKTDIDTKNILSIGKNISSYVKGEFDLFLFGSRATYSYYKSSDFDYVLILKEPSSIKQLSHISLQLNTLINQKEKASVKVFDNSTFQQFIFQDYFRFYEYKSYNKLLIGNGLHLNSFDISINIHFAKKQLINSVIIQYWWSIVTISMNNENDELILSKLISRIQRNSVIYKSLTGEFISIETIKKLTQKDSLWHKINNLTNTNSLNFLQNYLQRYEHERINKLEYYKYAINEKMDSINTTINYLNEKIIWN